MRKFAASQDMTAVGMSCGASHSRILLLKYIAIQMQQGTRFHCPDWWLGYLQIQTAGRWFGKYTPN